MKMSPMIVQGLWEYKSPLLQLPYITEDHLKYFTNRKKHIKSLLQLAQLPGEERRQVMRFLNDTQYDDVMKVLGNMPYIHFQVNTEGELWFWFLLGVKHYLCHISIGEFRQVVLILGVVLKKNILFFD